MISPASARRAVAIVNETVNKTANKTLDQTVDASERCRSPESFCE
jgi:hypothetical protein